MYFFEGFADELLKLAQDDILGPSPIKVPSKKQLAAQKKPRAVVPKPRAPAPSLGLRKKKTFVPGMTQKQVKSWERRSRMPAPKVQRFKFKNP